MRNIRHKQVRQDRKRRNMVFLTVVALLSIYLTLNLLLGDNSLKKYIELKSTRDMLLAENHQFENQKEDVTNELETIKKNPQMIEGVAREYGFTKEGELIFKFDDND